MFKKLFTILAILVIVFGVSSSLVLAKNDKNSDIPEEDGIYNVPGHPELKVRVFVHKAKLSPNPTSALQCGLSDIDSLAIVDAAGWKLPASFTYNLNPNSVPTYVGSGNWPIIAEKSFATWTNQLSGKINIIKGTNTSTSRYGLDGKNIIAWGTASGSALGVTYIWYNPSTKAVRELDTIMNQKFSWAWSGSPVCAYSGVYDAQNILTHELGHWMGLNDEYTAGYVNNTMYGYGSKTEVKKDTLTTGDIKGLVAIYK